MKNKLFDAQGNEVPERPSACNKKIHALVINKGVDALFKSKYCPFKETEKFKLILSLVRHYSPFCDEFELAKDFESEGWNVNRDFIDKLEEVTGYITSAFDDQIKEWFEQYQPIPPFKVGTRLVVESHNETEGGVITAINGCAYYEVKLDSHSDSTRRLIRFEDAKLFG